MNEIIKSYVENGFYVAKSLVSKEVIDETIVSIKKHFDNQLKLLNQEIPNDVYDSMKLLHKVDIERYKKTAGSLWRKMRLYNLLHHENIQNFVKENFGWNDIVIPGGQVVHIQADSLKIPNLSLKCWDCKKDLMLPPRIKIGRNIIKNEGTKAAYKYLKTVCPLYNQ